MQLENKKSLTPSLSPKQRGEKTALLFQAARLKGDSQINSKL